MYKLCVGSRVSFRRSPREQFWFSWICMYWSSRVRISARTEKKCDELHISFAQFEAGFWILTLNLLMSNIQRRLSRMRRSICSQSSIVDVTLGSSYEMYIPSRRNSIVACSTQLKTIKRCEIGQIFKSSHLQTLSNIKTELKVKRWVQKPE